MNREETIEAIKVMQAFVDGEVIKTSINDVDYKSDGLLPVWNWYGHKYHVKPKPIVVWVALSNNGKPMRDHYPDKEDTEMGYGDRDDFWKAVKLVEEQ